MNFHKEYGKFLFNNKKISYSYKNIMLFNEKNILDILLPENSVIYGNIFNRECSHAEIWYQLFCFELRDFN